MSKKPKKERDFDSERELIDREVDKHLNGVVEELEKHAFPTLGSYENFLRRELDWIKRTKERSRKLFLMS